MFGLALLYAIFVVFWVGGRVPVIYTHSKSSNLPINRLQLYLMTTHEHKQILVYLTDC